VAGPPTGKSAKASASSVEVDAQVAAEPSVAESFGADSHPALADDSEPEGFPIKGNASSKLYHVPGSAFYNRTIAEVWFKTAEAAEAAGFQLPPSQRGESADDTTDGEES
jgi:hypothetical protein